MILMKSKKVIFFSIFLNFFLQSNVILFSQEYLTGTNKITREIFFRLSVEDSIFVANDTELDFGKILKGSTGIVQKETSIKVEGGENIDYVLAEYEDNILEEGWKRTTIDFYNDSEEKRNQEMENFIEKASLDVYLKQFNDKYTMEKDFNGKMVGEIPIVGQIRSTENVKIGKYKGTVKVKVTAITLNKINDEG